jgi:hypothetical protein
MALAAAARRRRPRPLLLCSIRDILIAPAQRARIDAAHQRLADLYDGVLVHGDPDVVPLERSWPLDPALKSHLHYTGYVDDGAMASPVVGDDADGAILVSAGGSDAGRKLYETAIAAAALLPDRPWRVLVGGGVPEAAFGALQRNAPENVTVERSRGDFRALLGRCAVSVSQAGYNTMLDLLGARARAVVVPFADGGETEQLQRAQCLAERRLLRVLPGERLSPESLAAAIRDALAAPRPAASGIRTDGLDGTVRIVEELAGARPFRPPATSKANWSALHDALARLSGDGRSLTLWWRDDDAVRPTPALERLIGMARRYGMPVAVAVVPAKADGALGQRLAAEPLASVLVHGLAHDNHAPEGEKKSEFGPHRPLDRLVADASLALETARARLGHGPEPIFVPPWNRLAADLVPRLSAVGYRGLSTFGAAARREPAPGLVQIDTHIDLIDWHGTRGLRCESDIIATVTGAVVEVARNIMDEAEPIGLLTHHLVHDEDTWTFCERLLETFAGRPGIRVAAATQLFGSAPSK